MSPAPTVTPGISFSRKRAVRVASSVGTAGMLVGISLAGASPALAATDADCNSGNTVDASTGTAADIQVLFDASEPIVCLSGTFVLDSPLWYNGVVTVHGLTDAVLDGNNTTAILVAAPDADLTVENIEFINGNSTDYAGAIFGYDVAVYNSRFENNFGLIGGAILALNVEIYDSVFVDNEALYTGGAVGAWDSLVVEGSTFRGNAGTSGGAIYAYGPATVTASTFEENVGYYEGGAIGAEANLDVANSTFVGNTAEFHSSDGGAIWAVDGTVLQSTFVDNSAVTGQAVSAASDTLLVHGNIFAGSTAAAQLGSDGGNFQDQGANLFTTAEAAETAVISVHASSVFGLTTSALFNGATLANNFGPTQTIALYAGSPAVDAVPAGGYSLAQDQRGVARSGVSDAGAYEYIASKAALAATGSAPAGWLAAAAALLLAGGAAVLGMARRSRRTSP